MIRSEARREAGVALPLVLLVLLMIAGSSVSSLWLMNRQQASAGFGYHSAAAFSLAEAGVYRAVAILEGVAPDGSPGRNWRPADYSGEVAIGPLSGRFTLTLTDDVDGAVLVTSVGEVAGVRRGIRARVRLASPALLAALYGRSYIRLDGPPAATVILPHRAATVGRPWIDIAAGEGLWFAGALVSINKPGAPVAQDPGPTNALPGGEAPGQPVAARVLLSNHADVVVDRDQQTVGLQQLRAMGMNIEREELRARMFPEPPEVDQAFYRARAAANQANADLNKAVGDTLRDSSLALKRDSLYTPAQFDTLQAFTYAEDRPFRLEGIVYVTGRVRLIDSWGLEITDGALVTEGPVTLGRRSWLEIVHSRSTRSLPGLIARNASRSDGGIFVGADARLRVHGLVYADWLFEVAGGAQVDIVGCVLGDDRTQSFWNQGASVVIRYDPAVLGTPGLSVPSSSPVVAWITDWKEAP